MAIKISGRERMLCPYCNENNNDFEEKPTITKGQRTSGTTVDGWVRLRCQECGTESWQAEKDLQELK